MAAARNMIGNGLIGLGVTLLFASLLLTPTSTLLADTGDLAPPAFCLPKNQCANGCPTKLWPGTCPNPPNDAINCNWTMQGCNTCTCRGCYDVTGLICQCKCQAGSPPCFFDATIQDFRCPIP